MNKGHADNMNGSGIASGRRTIRAAEECAKRYPYCFAQTFPNTKLSTANMTHAYYPIHLSQSQQIFENENNSKQKS